MNFLFALLVALFALLMGYAWGRKAEAKHIARIIRTEACYSKVINDLIPLIKLRVASLNPYLD